MGAKPLLQSTHWYHTVSCMYHKLSCGAAVNEESDAKIPSLISKASCMSNMMRMLSQPATVVKVSKNTPSSKYATPARSEEHTSELQSRPHLVCRLLLEKKKKKKIITKKNKN